MRKKRYESIAALQKDQQNLREGEEIYFRGQLVTYHERIVYEMLSTMDDEELGIGGLVEGDLERISGEDMTE